MHSFYKFRLRSSSQQSSLNKHTVKSNRSQTKLPTLQSSNITSSSSDFEVRLTAARHKFKQFDDNAKPLTIYNSLKAAVMEITQLSEEFLTLHFNIEEINSAKYLVSLLCQTQIELCFLMQDQMLNLCDRLHVQNFETEDALLLQMINSMEHDEEFDNYSKQLEKLSATHDRLKNKRRVNDFLEAALKAKKTMSDIKHDARSENLQFHTLSKENEQLYAQLKQLTQIQPEGKSEMDNVINLSYVQLSGGIPEYISHIALHEKFSNNKLQFELEKISQQLKNHYEVMFKEQQEKIEQMENKLKFASLEMERKQKQITRLNYQIEKLSFRAVQHDVSTQINIDIPAIHDQVKQAQKRNQQLRIISRDLQKLDGFYDEEEIESPFKFSLSCTVSIISLIYQDYFLLSLKKFARNNIFQVPTSKYLQKTITENQKTAARLVPFGEFTKFWFLKKIGQKTVARVFYNNFLNSVEQFYKSSGRIKTFVEMVGLFPLDESSDRVHNSTLTSFQSDQTNQGKDKSFQQLGIKYVTLQALSRSVYYQTPYSLMTFFEVKILFKQTKNDDLAFFMLSPFLPNPIYEFENVIMFKKAWQILPLLSMETDNIEQKFDTFAMSQLRSQNVNQAHVKEEDMFLKISAKDIQSIQNVTFDIMAQFALKQNSAPWEMLVLKFFTSLLLKLKQQNFPQQTSFVNLSTFTDVLESCQQSIRGKSNLLQELFAIFHRKVDISRLHFISEKANTAMERAVRLKLFDLNNDEQRELTYNYFDFIWHLVMNCIDGKVNNNIIQYKNELREFYGGFEQNSYHKQPKKGPLGVGREGENTIISTFSIAQLVYDHVSMCIVCEEILEQVRNLVDRIGERNKAVEEQYKQLKRTIGELPHAYRKSLQSYGVQVIRQQYNFTNMNQLIQRVSDIDAARKLWKDLRKLLDQLILKTEGRFE